MNRLICDAMGARPFDGPRIGFNPDDPQYRQICCSIAPADVSTPSGHR